MSKRLVWASLVMAWFSMGYASAPDAESAPEGWRTYAVREELAPRFWVVRDPKPTDPPTYALGLAGRGDDAVDGRWQRKVPVTAGQYYVFTAQYQAKTVATPSRSVLARILWFDAAGKQVAQAEYPVTS